MNQSADLYGSHTMRCAVVQLCSTEDTAANMERAKALIDSAAKDGAEVVALPENFAWLRINPSHSAPTSALSDAVVTALRPLAMRLGVHLILGGVAEPSEVSGKTHNASIWLGADGRILGRYRKQHLFDIDIPGQESHRESANVAPGNEDVTVVIGDGHFGLSICYDLRFPELYRRLVDRGANVLTVPAAFTATTGKDHWHALLRARAIENQCYVIAPGQWGHHGGARRSYGHSLIIDPWGTVVADVPDGEGYAVARLDWSRVRDVRSHLPCLSHRRLDLPRG